MNELAFMDDGVATGFCIEAMVQKALAQMKRTPRAVQPQRREPTNAEVAADLQRKALPAARRDALVIQRAEQENELKRRSNEASWAAARIAQPYEELA